MNNEQHQQQEIPSIPSLPPVPSSTAMMMMGIKQEDRNLSVCLSKEKKRSFFLIF